MPFVIQFQSLIEHRLAGLAPPEIVSILAELLVAAAFFLPVLGLMGLTNWVFKRSKPAH